ncbi:MAG: RidA family protein [Candidatus Zixiibacteriota bacterium]|nr:MAG: RidA family protein [candidate division Zixibacteria bacterium]
MYKVKVSSGSPYERSIGFSRAIRVGDRVLTAGTAPVADDGSTFAPGDAYSQARRCLDIIRTAIEKAGARMDDIVRTRVYLTDVSFQDEVGRAHAEYFAEIRPVATMVIVKGLVRDDWLVEIEAEGVIQAG